MSQGGLALLLRLNKSWHDGISAEDLYEITRAWWVMSPANAPRVERVLAVAGGVVREVYRPTQWLPSPVEGLENRIGFDPDFVYRHRPVKPAVSTAVLAQALASMTKRVDDFADKAGYDS